MFLGGVHARYAGSISGSAAFFSGRLRHTSGLSAAGLDGSISQFESGEWAVQFGGQGTTIRPLTDRFFAGLTAAATANTFEGGSWNGSGVVGPLVGFATGPWIAQVSSGAGALRTVDRRSSVLGQVTGAVQRRITPELSVGGSISGTFADSATFADFSARASFRRAAWSVDASLGARAGDLSGDPWAQVSGSYTLADQWSVEATLGSYPRDVAGFTDGFFVTAGVRLHLRGAAPRYPPVVAFRRIPNVERLSDGSVRLRFQDIPADRLAVAGEWNGWEPSPLTRQGRDWVLELRVPPGVYRYALVADGERWFVPAGAPTVPDDFGGTVALLVVD